jgi:hypothetical protein
LNILTSFAQWFQQNTYLVLGGLFVWYIIAFNKIPSVTAWQAFLDCFESKGGQLVLLWVTNFIFLSILVRYWDLFDAHVQTVIVGLLSGVNGAFLGAVGARNTSNNGAKPPVPDTLTASFVPSKVKP